MYTQHVLHAWHTQDNLLQLSRDPLSAWLDGRYGSEVRDHSIFQALTRHWEEEYHKDMHSLNVSGRPTV